MTELEKAARIALEALETLKRAFFKNAPDEVEDWEREWVDPAMEAITALTAALEQPAYRAVKTWHDGKPVYVAEQPAERPEPPHCMVGGLIKNNAMCGHVIQMKFCGYGGPCQYKGEIK